MNSPPPSPGFLLYTQFSRAMANDPQLEEAAINRAYEKYTKKVHADYFDEPWVQKTYKRYQELLSGAELRRQDATICAKARVRTNAARLVAYLFVNGGHHRPVCDLHCTPWMKAAFAAEVTEQVKLLDMMRMMKVVRA
jgi:hypothetical protein